jgi:mono/diheme cytochrome c family protein
MKKTVRAQLSAAFIWVGLLVSAGCGGGASPESGAMTSANPGIQSAALAVPAAPTGVTATGGINKVTLSWNPVSGADSYHIYWSPNPNVTTATGTRIAAAVSPYQQVGLTVSESYYYIVTAVNSAGESVASPQAVTVVATDGANLYATYCAGCHGPVTATSIKDGMPDQIKAAIAGNTGGMGVLSILTVDQINTIAQQLPCH